MRDHTARSEDQDLRHHDRGPREDGPKEQQIRHVAMGICWLPVFNVLEEEPMVVNARHIKAAPERKTDVKDAEWIADLLQDGMLRGSFIPDRGQRELQELVRHRRSPINQHA